MPSPFDLFNPGPATEHAAVTPSDNVSGNHPLGLARGLYIGATGNVAIVSAQGTAVTYVGVPAGAIIQVQNIRVNSTNTTASSIVALF